MKYLVAILALFCALNCFASDSQIAQLPSGVYYVTHDYVTEELQYCRVYLEIYDLYFQTEFVAYTAAGSKLVGFTSNYERMGEWCIATRRNYWGALLMWSHVNYNACPKSDFAILPVPPAELEVPHLRDVYEPECFIEGGVITLPVLQPIGM